MCYLNLDLIGHFLQSKFYKNINLHHLPITQGQATCSRALWHRITPQYQDVC